MTDLKETDGIKNSRPVRKRSSAAKAFVSRRRTELLIFATLWPTYAYFYQSAQHNGAARFDQAHAIIQDGVLYIDHYRFNTADVVEISRAGRPDHVYPNKAPGHGKKRRARRP